VHVKEHRRQPHERAVGGCAGSHLENDAEEEHCSDTKAARLSKVIVTVVLERPRGAGEQHADEGNEIGGHKLLNGAWRDQHRKANKDQFLPCLNQLPPKVGGLIILTEGAVQVWE
jgi:hypothetical protein